MKNILALVDFSAITDAVIEAAATTARALGAHIWLLNVAPREPDFLGVQVKPKVVTDPIPEDVQERYDNLMEHAKSLEQRGIAVTPRLIRGNRVDVVLDEADRIRADLIVVGTHGRGALYRTMMGSVSEGVFRKANCPLLVVPTRIIEKNKSN